MNNDVIFFVYVFTFPILATTFVLYLLRRDKQRDEKSVYFTIFLFTALAGIILDMLSYYGNFIVDTVGKQVVHEAMYITYAVVTFSWVSTIKELYKCLATRIIKIVMGLDLIAYIIAITFIIFTDGSWEFFHVTQMVMSVLLFSEIIVISIDIRRSEIILNATSVIFIMVSFLIALDKGSYLFGDTDHLWEAGYYSLLWLIIGILMFIYVVVTTYLGVDEIKEVGEQIDDSLAVLGERYGLTNREIEIIKEIYEGHGNLEIANRLVISEGTVKFHVHNILTKMNLNSRVAIISEIQRNINSK